MADKDNLSLALTTQSNRDNDPDVTDKVTTEIKNSAMFQNNWQDLLQSAPISIGATGSLYVACFTTTAKSIKLVPPVNGGFKYIEDDTLGAALIRCGDQGRVAFMTAQTGLQAVGDRAKRASSKVADIIDTLGDPNTARKLLKPQMGQLKSIADDCYQRVTEIDQKFEQWLMYTSELHAVCVGTQASDEEKLKATEIGLAVQQTKFDSQKNTVADAKAASDKLSKQLDVASEAFKKASDNFPSGWDILGQQIVGGLADMATTCLGQVISGYAANMNPMARATAGVSMFSNVVTPELDKVGPGNQNQQPTIAGQTPTAPPLQQQPLPPNSTDSAYSNVQKDMPFLTVLNSILTGGTNGGVDWTEASGGDGAGKSVDYVVSVLTDAKQSFASVATNAQPSTDLTEVLSTSLDIATKVRDAQVEGGKSGGSFPAADSAEVKDWQTRFQAELVKAQKLAATARSLPGTSPAGIPLMADSADPAVQIAKTNAKSAQAQATLEAAKNRLSTTQDSFMRSQELFQKNTALLLDQENQLTAIQGELMNLNKTKVSLEEVKTVLESCVKLIVGVKVNIVNLCLFFASMSTSVDAVVNSAVKSFLEDITAGVSSDDSNNPANFKIGTYTLSDLTRSILYSAAISIRAQFLVFAQVASMWTKLSTQYIMPGVQMLDQLSVGDDVNQQQKVASQLHNWSEQALAGVKSIAKDAQDQIIESMSSDIDQVQSVTKRIPASPPMQAAITAGTDVVKSAAQDAIVSNANAAPLRRFGVHSSE